MTKRYCSKEEWQRWRKGREKLTAKAVAASPDESLRITAIKLACQSGGQSREDLVETAELFLSFLQGPDRQLARPRTDQDRSAKCPHGLNDAAGNPVVDFRARWLDAENKLIGLQKCLEEVCEISNGVIEERNEWRAKSHNATKPLDSEGNPVP